MKITTPRQVLAPLSALHGADYNPRTMPDSEMTNLMSSLREFGFVQPVVARKEDGLILGGHQRIEAIGRIAAKDGIDLATVRIPIIWLEGIDDKRAKVLNLAMNRISGDWDYTKLAEVLSGLDEGLELTGFGQDEISSIIGLILTDPITPTGESDEDVDESLADQRLRFTFKLGEESEAVLCRKALAAYGMTGPGNAAKAFVDAMRVAMKVRMQKPRKKAKDDADHEEA